MEKCSERLVPRHPTLHDAESAKVRITCGGENLVFE